MEIKPGTKIPKPVITQEECDAYSAVVDAITAHNAAVADAASKLTDDEYKELTELLAEKEAQNAQNNS